jgi:alkyl hydroperoxide reductase subunit AhpF
MSLIQDADRKLIAQRFEGLAHTVTLHMFTQENECRWCETTRQIVEELAGLSPKVRAEIHDFLTDAELAKQYQIDKIPAIAVVGERDWGIRFYGVPAGYEFTPFLEAVLDAGRGEPELLAPLRAELAKVDKPVHLQVMVTPT